MAGLSYEERVAGELTYFAREHYGFVLGLLGSQSKSEGPLWVFKHLSERSLRSCISIASKDCHRKTVPNVIKGASQMEASCGVPLRHPLKVGKDKEPAPRDSFPLSPHN